MKRILKFFTKFTYKHNRTFCHYVHSRYIRSQGFQNISLIKTTNIQISCSINAASALLLHFVVF